MLDISAIAETLGRMNEVKHPELLAEIEAFLGRTGMGESYFGKVAASNSELVKRVRGGGRVWPETIDRLRSFMATREEEREQT